MFAFVEGMKLMMNNCKISNELLKNEDQQQKPARQIITFIVSLVAIVLLFSPFINGNPGSGGGVGGGDGMGKGTAIGSGTGSGQGFGHGGGKGVGTGDGIGKSNTDGLGKGDVGVKDVQESVGIGQELEVKNHESENFGKVVEKLSPKKAEEEKLELPSKANWLPSAFKLGVKKGSGKRKSKSKTAGRGGGGGGGTKPMGTGDVSFRIYWKPAIHDIDLHVIDPNGHHLSFGNKHCACAGQLDVDDTTSGGPENIFWPKDKAPEGEYEFYVVYYEGGGLKNVRIEVRRDGKLTKTYKCTLRERGEESRHYRLIHEKKSKF